MVSYSSADCCDLASHVRPSGCKPGQVVARHHIIRQHRRIQGQLRLRIGVQGPGQGQARSPPERPPGPRGFANRSPRQWIPAKSPAAPARFAPPVNSAPAAGNPPRRLEWLAPPVPPGPQAAARWIPPRAAAAQSCCRVPPEWGKALAQPTDWWAGLWGRQPPAWVPVGGLPLPACVPPGPGRAPLGGGRIFWFPADFFWRHAFATKASPHPQK